MNLRRRRASALFLLTVCGVISTDCLAHARWLLDGPIEPRSPATDLTTAPCGGVPRTETPKLLTPGQTINVEWEETIDHPGYYVISFSPAGDADFDQYVLAPKIVDTQDGTPTPHIYQAQVTLPDQACTQCTVQLIQVMEEDPQNPVNYYSCADIQLAADPGGPPSPVTDPAATPNADGVQLTWKASPNSSTLVLMDSATITARPTDGTRYTIGQTLGTARVVYQGTGTAATLPPLPAGATIYLMLAAFDNQLRYAAPAFATATLSSDPANEAPVVILRITQRDREVTQVTPDGGDVVVSAEVRDPNRTEQPTYDWALTDNRLIDQDNKPESLTVDPRPLPATTYVVSVTVTDNGIPPASTTASANLLVTAPSAPPALPEEPTPPVTPLPPENPTRPTEPPNTGNPINPGIPPVPDTPTTPDSPTTPSDPSTPRNPPMPNTPDTGSPGPGPLPDSGDSSNVVREKGSGTLTWSLLAWLTSAVLMRRRRARNNFPVSDT